MAHSRNRERQPRPYRFPYPSVPAADPETVSIDTTLSISTAHGIGSLSGKFIQAVGSLELKGARYLVWQRKLAVARSLLCRIHDDEGGLQKLQQVYEEILELTREDQYPIGVRNQAMQLLVSPINRGCHTYLLKTMTKRPWQSTEISLFIKSIVTFTLEGLFRTGKVNSIGFPVRDPTQHIAFRTVPYRSLDRKDPQRTSHSLMAPALVHLVAAIGKSSASGCQAVIRSGVLEFFLIWYLLDFYIARPENFRFDLRDAYWSALKALDAPLAQLSNPSLSWLSFVPRDGSISAHHLEGRSRLWAGLNNSDQFVRRRIVDISDWLPIAPNHLTCDPGRLSSFIALGDLLQFSSSKTLHRDTTAEAHRLLSSVLSERRRERLLTVYSERKFPKVVSLLSRLFSHWQDLLTAQERPAYPIICNGAQHSLRDLIVTKPMVPSRFVQGIIFLVGKPPLTEPLDVDHVIETLLAGCRTDRADGAASLTKDQISSICQAARRVLLDQPVLLELMAPVTIIGDLHGQYDNLLRLFERVGFPPSTNCLFLGNYVNGGKQSVENLLLLLCYKIKFPSNFFLLRGNHECAYMSRVCGFYAECQRRLDIQTWDMFVDVFNCMPIAAIVRSRIFCVHSGLSPLLASMDHIREIQRPTAIPDHGLLHDLLWSEPSDDALGWEDSLGSEVNSRNQLQARRSHFGQAVVDQFLALHDLDLICRGDSPVGEGYAFGCGQSVVTIFSAPSHLNRFNNYGAAMRVDKDLLCSFTVLKPRGDGRLHRAKKSKYIILRKDGTLGESKGIVLTPY